MDTFLDTFLNWDYIWEVFPDLLRSGLLNTLILAGASAVIGTVFGMVLAVMGLSTKRWLRWPARIYTDIFRGYSPATSSAPTPIRSASSR